MSGKLVLICTSDVHSLDIELQFELYNELYRLVYDMVFYITRSHSCTEDIVQESFMRAIEKAPKYIEMKKVNGWIITLTRNVALNYLRKNRIIRDELAASSVFKEETVDYNRLSTVESEVEDKYNWNKL